MNGERLFADVVRYAEFGEHRTGGRGDAATTDWLAAELRVAGLDVVEQPWNFRRFVLETCELRVGETALDYFSFYFPRTTGETPVGARVVRFVPGTKRLYHGEILVVFAEDAGRAIYSAGVNELAGAAASAGAGALVVVVPSQSQDLAAVNARAPYVEQPLPLPAVIVAQEHQPLLSAAIANGETGTLNLQGRVQDDAPARNVIAKLERGPTWVVVSTPTTGWFTCAGERGPGVALFLALARWAAASDSPFSFLFLANAGHELDNLGAYHTLDTYPPPAAAVAAWIHLGASIATRAWEEDPSWHGLPDRAANANTSSQQDNPDRESERPREPHAQNLRPLDHVHTDGNLVSAPALLPRVQEAFARVPGYTPRSTGPVLGELRHFLDAGYPALGFFGGHAYFHTRGDTPATTAPEFLEPVGQALVEFLDMLVQ